MNKQQQKLRMMIITALFAAIIGVLAQLTIPLPIVPFTGQTLAIGLAATILGSRYGSIAVLLYLFIGAVGVPVFAEFSGGISKLVGPTGGYLVGFVPTAFVIGWMLEKTSFSFKNAMYANTVGMLITLAFGTIWLKIALQMSWPSAFAIGFAPPFIVGGFLKAALSSWIGITVRRRLELAKLLTLPSGNLSKSA